MPTVLTHAIVAAALAPAALPALTRRTTAVAVAAGVAGAWPRGAASRTKRTPW